MSLSAYSEPTAMLTAQRGGLASATVPAKMHPSEIALTLSADVLRLPYPPATRLVLAEIVSLYAATGLCDCSDTHFASRLTISRDTASRAVQQLEDEKLIAKTVDKSAGFYRTLTPLPATIVAKAQTNPYPQNAGRGASRKMPEPYPQNAASPTRKMPVDLAAESDTNTPLKLPVNFQEDSTPSANASAASEKKIEEYSITSLPDDDEQLVPPVARPPRAKPAKAKSKSELEPEHFPAFWAAYKRHEDRPSAVKAFARLNPDEQASAADWATRWLARRTNWIDSDGNDFRPYAATWLKKRRWEELVEPLPTPSSAVSHVTTSNQQRPAASGRYSQATRSGSADRFLSEGLQIGEPLTGSIADL